MTVAQPVRFGYNWDTESIPFEKAIPTMQAANASAHLMMVNPRSFWLGVGDIANIKKVLAALPNCELIIRIFHTNQGDWKTYPDAIQYENHWRWYKSKFTDAEWTRLIWDDPCNEAGTSNDSVTEIRAYVKRCVLLVEAAGRVGMKFAVGAWSVGTPHEKWYENEFMVLWRAIATNRQAISYHGYATIPPLAGETLPIELVLDPVASLASMTEQRVSLDHAGWLIARMYRVIKIFKKYELGVPELYITEGIIDNIYNSSNSDVKEEWKRLHGMNEAMDDPRGPRSHTNFLNKMFAGQNKTFSQMLGVIHRWVRKFIFYHPAFKAVCLFALNFQWDYRYGGYTNDGQHKQALSNFDRPEYDDFRMIELPAINAEIINMEDIPMAVSFPSKSDPAWRDGTLTAIGKNARIQPDGTAAKVTLDLSKPVQAKRYPTLNRDAPDAFDWYAYQINGNDVWIANTTGLIWEEVIPDEPKYQVYLGHMSLNLTAKEIDDYATTYETLAMIFREALLTVEG